MPKVIFNSRNTAFYSELKKNVENYFSENHLRKTGNWKLYLKAATLVPAALILYAVILFAPMSAIVLTVLSTLMGFVLASIGFNVMHDACHGSYSSRKWLNETLGLTLNALGGNAFIWKFKHNIIHHTYTNVDGIDDDIAKSPIMRQCQTQKWFPAHRFQHIYVVLVYAISSFAWVFIMDFVKYFSQRVFRTNLQKMNISEHFMFWISKVLYLFFYIALPVLMIGWGSWALMFVFMHLSMGLTLALVFQLAHVVEHAEFELVEQNDKIIENEWAIHQVKTTANFAPKNKIVSWFVGGLNFQVEHHLFPRVSHIHYPRISRIVEETCRKYNLPYNVYSTMTGAVASHFRMMKSLGKKPAYAFNKTSS
jgi:linoleoyl-CoA desaturase